MDGGIVLGRSQRNRLLDLYRKDPCPCVRLRAHVILLLLLLLSAGHPWSLICAVLFCSSATVARWKQRFEAGGVDALRAEARGRRPALLAAWAVTVVTWVRTLTPRDFGYCRSRWCCATLAVVLWDTHRVRVSDDTVRRVLRRDGMVWRRPRPVPGKVDPRGTYKLRRVRELLRGLAGDEAAVFEDEADLNLNPEIGCAWMPRGQQAGVVTPGTNVKRYMAGSISWRTGEVVETLGARRDAGLFVRHLGEPRRRFRRYRVIHVVCDNARSHTAEGSKLVRAYLAKRGHRIKLHYLPAYAPKHNPVERAWWHLREQVTRNHRCASIDELVKLTLAWLEERGAFKIEGGMYQRLKAKAA